jgi:hypothetical protein
VYTFHRNLLEGVESPAATRGVSSSYYNDCEFSSGRMQNYEKPIYHVIFLCVVKVMLCLARVTYLYRAKGNGYIERLNEET